MRSNNHLSTVVLGAALATVCTGGCKKSAEAEREEASRTELRSAKQVNEAMKKTIDEHNDWLAAVRREQLEIRGRLQEEIDRIDKQLHELKVEFDEEGGFVIDPNSKDAKKAEDLVKRREKLTADVELVELSDERGWDEVKAAVEQDLGKPRGKI